MMKKYYIFLFILLHFVFACEKVTDKLGFTEPEVKSVTPGNSAQNVASDTDIRVVFSASMDKLKTNESFSLSGSESGSVAGFFDWPNSKTLVFTPKKNLSSTEFYTISVSTDAEDSNGNDLKESFESVFYLTDDFEKPEVSTYTPVNDQIGVLPDSPVQITFSEAIDLDTIYDGIVVSPSITGRFAWNIGQTVFTFTPDYNFTMGTTYTVTINETIKDLNGNTLREQVSFKFTVGDDFEAPSLVSIQQNPVGTTVVTGFPVNTPSWLENVLNHGAERHNNIVLTFSELIARKTVLDAISISPSADYYIASNDEDTVFELQLNEPLDPETIYNIIVSSTITDIQNNGLDKEYRYQIITDGDNSLRPTIINFSDPHLTAPGIWDNTIDQPLTFPGIDPEYTDIVITFSTKIKPTSVSLSVQKIAGGSSTAPGITNLRWDNTDPDFDRLIFDIYDLEAGNTYKISVDGGKNGLKDINDNWMQDDYNQMFSME